MGEIKLVDRFGRTINYLRISITDRCNLRCRYCMPEEGVNLIPHSEILRYEEIIEVLKVFSKLGLERVRFTGGEPLIREGFLDFLREVKRHFPDFSLSLTTNGILLSKFSQDLISIGLDSLNVSLDTLQASRYKYITRLGDIKNVWKGIKELLSEGLHLKINVVVIRNFNDDEILNFINLTKLNLIVRFIEFMPITKDIWKKEDFVSVDEIKRLIERKYGLIPLVSRFGFGPATYYQLPWGGIVGLIGAISHHFCQSCNRLRLTADGRLKTCLFGGPEVNLKEAIRRGVSDEELARLIKDAIDLKPQGWFSIEGKTGEPMSRIGG